MLLSLERRRGEKERQIETEGMEDRDKDRAGREIGSFCFSYCDDLCSIKVNSGLLIYSLSLSLTKVTPAIAQGCRPRGRRAQTEAAR